MRINQILRPSVFEPFYPTCGRNNNFDLLRILAAALVIYGHSWDLTRTPGEPFFALTSQTLVPAGLGVWIFFFISGYLVSESYIRRGLVPFVEARILRIYPAFIVSLLFAILIGSFVTTLPLSDFLCDELTWRYLSKSID